MKHVMKVGCRLVTGLSAVGLVGGAVASPFADSVYSTTSSGYYTFLTTAYTPDRAVDGVFGTCWLANGKFDSAKEYFIGVELVNGVRPRSYSVSEGDGVVLDRRPKSFKLYASPDGIHDWVELDSQADVEWSGDGLETKSFAIDQAKMPDGVYYRDFKLVLIEPVGQNDNCAFAVDEFDMDVEGTFDPAGLTPLDIMETARAGGAEHPFSVSSTGEMTGSGDSKQLFDGDLTVNGSAAYNKNGRALFKLDEQPSVTVSFDMAAFGNRPVFVKRYGFRMATQGAGSGWDVPGRFPAKWTVSVSDKEVPAEGDWVVLDSRPATEANDYLVDELVAARHVRFSFTSAKSDKTYVQLGEICISGYVGPDMPGTQSVSPWRTGAVEPHADGTASVSVKLLQLGLEVAPYDLLALCRTGERVYTNEVGRNMRTTGQYEVEIPGLRLSSDYSLCLATRTAAGAVTKGDSVEFRSAEEIAGSRLPVEYEELEYIESTENGAQHVECGFSPTGSFGFEYDLIGYNVLAKEDSYNGTKTGYGVYLATRTTTSLIISSSTATKGNYTTGSFWYKDAINPNAYLSVGKRMTIALHPGEYSVVCEGVTNRATAATADLPANTAALTVFGGISSTEPKTGKYGVMRLYSLKTFTGTEQTLAHDFVPARRVADGLCGLYDLEDDSWHPNGGTTPFLAGNVVLKDLQLASVRINAQGVLRAKVSRTRATDSDVYVAWGATYAGTDSTAWQHTAKCGSFAADEQVARFETPSLGSEIVYVRFYTPDGFWSQTIYLPDLERKRSGLVLLLK